MSRTTTVYHAFVDEPRDAYDAQQQPQEEWVAEETLTELSVSIDAETSNIDHDDDDEDDETDEAEKAEKDDRDDKDDEDENQDTKDDAWSATAWTTSAHLSGRD